MHWGLRSAVAVAIVAALPAVRGTAALGGVPTSLPAGAMAVVNGQPIPEKELNDLLLSRFGAAGARHLLTLRLIRQALDERKLTISAEEIAARLAPRMAESGGEAAFNELLRRRGVSLDYFKTYELLPEMGLTKLGERAKGDLFTERDLVDLVTQQHGRWGVQRLAQIHLARQELARQGLTLAEKDVDAALAKAIEQAGGAAAFEERLRQTGVTRDYLRRFEVELDVALGALTERLKDRAIAAEKDKDLYAMLAARLGDRALRQLVMIFLAEEELKRQKGSVSEAEIEALLVQRKVLAGGIEAFDQRLRRERVSLAFVKRFELSPELAMDKVTTRLREQVITDQALTDLLLQRYGRQGAQQLVVTELLKRELKRLDLSVSKEEVDALLAQRIAQARGEAAYNEQLRQAGVTVGYVRTYELMPELALVKIVEKLKAELVSTPDLVTFLQARYGRPCAQQLIMIHLLRQEMALKGVTVNQAEIDAALAKRIAEAGGEAGFEALLRRTVVTRSYYLTYELPLEVARDKLTAKDTAVTDQDVKQAHERKYGEQRLVRRIVLDRILVAADILKQLDGDSPPAFQTLVDNQSIDERVRQDRGLWGPFGRGGLAPTLKSVEEAAFRLKEPGDHSGIIQVGERYYIIRLERIVPPQDVKLESVEKDLRDELAKAKVASAWLKLQQDLLRAATLVLREDLRGG